MSEITHQLLINQLRDQQVKDTMAKMLELIERSKENDDE